MSGSFTDAFDRQYLQETMMGPNAMRVTEELTAHLPMRDGLRVLDLGCGMGISSVLLAEKYQATVFACDLWVRPTENKERFARLGLLDRVVPLAVDATRELPFAEEYFDLLISVDAYHYFGAGKDMLPKLLPLLKKGGRIAIAVPGLQEEFPGNEVPVELQPFWHPDMYTFHSCAWWRRLWQKEPGLALESCREMDCCALAWAEWLSTSNPYAVSDRDLIAAEGGKYFNLVQISGRRI